MTDPARPNVSYPFGDGQPPDNLPIVDQPVQLVNPVVAIDTLELVLRQLDVKVSLESLDDGDGTPFIFTSE